MGARQTLKLTQSRPQLPPTLSVFGIVTDSHVFQSAHLDKDRKLFVSDTYHWALGNRQIVQWIDKILHDAVEATP